MSPSTRCAVWGSILDGDGAVTVADVRRITKATARRIFVAHYFRRPRIAALPATLHASVFDMYVQCRIQRGEDPPATAERNGPRPRRRRGDRGRARSRRRGRRPEIAPDHLRRRLRHSRGATIITRWPTAGRPRGSSRGGAMVGKGGWITRAEGSSRSATTSATPSTGRGWRHGTDRGGT